MSHRPRRNVLDEDDEEVDEEEAFNTPESSAEHALFITQPDPEPYHELGTLSRSQKGKTPTFRKRSSSNTNIWASLLFCTLSLRSRIFQIPSFIIYPPKTPSGNVMIETNSKSKVTTRL